MPGSRPGSRPSSRDAPDRVGTLSFVQGKQAALRPPKERRMPGSAAKRRGGHDMSCPYKSGRRAPDRESGVKPPHSKIDRYTVQRMSSLLGIWQFLGCLPILVYGIHPIDCLSLVTHTYCGGDPFSKVDKSSKE